MILNDYEIVKLLDSAVKNSNLSLVNPASLDIRIGDEAILFDSSMTVDLTDFTDDCPYWVRPQQLLLTNSFEYFYFPNNIAGEFKLKSSVARQFFQHMKAGWIDPGWHGTLTMEFVNLSCKPFPIWEGKRIGQIIFHQLVSPCVNSYQGKYNGQIRAQKAKFDA